MKSKLRAKGINIKNLIKYVQYIVKKQLIKYVKYNNKKTDKVYNL